MAVDPGAELVVVSRLHDPGTGSSQEPRDLGVIEGREVADPPGGDVPPSFRVSPHVAGAAAASFATAASVVCDVADAHRPGPKPNSRPLPAWVPKLAWVLDDAVAVPGTGGRRVGVDGMLTFVPVVGDAAGVVVSMVVVLAGVAVGVSVPTALRMLLNVGFEAVVGLVPFAGAVFDLAFKANDRNVRLIEADLADRQATRRSSLAVLALSVSMVFAGVVLVVFVAVASAAVFVAAVAWLFSRL
jgi:hypothetical protein